MIRSSIQFGIIEACNRNAGAVLRTPAGVTPEASPMHHDSTPTHKSCTRCGVEKPLSEFYKAKRGLYGTRSQCKRCVSDDRNAYGKRIRQEQPDTARKWRRDQYLRNREWERLAYFDNRCAYCHAPLKQDGQDHIVPLSVGGDHTLDNVVPACRSCNARKNSLSLVECLMKGRL